MWVFWTFRSESLIPADSHKRKMGQINSGTFSPVKLSNLQKSYIGLKILIMLNYLNYQKASEIVSVNFYITVFRHHYNIKHKSDLRLGLDAGSIIHL